MYWKVLWGLLWLLFLPNTIYILTDLDHFIHAWSTETALQHLDLVLQYIILEAVGIATFLLAFLPFERIIRCRNLSQREGLAAIILFNFLIAFAMVLGKVERINSYVVFTQPVTFALSVVHVAESLDLWELTLLFGILVNGVYFLFRNTLSRHTDKFLQSFD